MKAWKNRTSHFVGCTISDLYQMLQRPFAVYCLKSPSTRTFTSRGSLLDRKLFYVGSTLVSIQSCQDARWRKLRLLQKNQAVNCELALHYFHTRSNFSQFCIIPVQFLDGDVDTRSFETRCIQLWKPRLNHPWIIQLNPTSVTRKSTPFQIQQTFTIKGSRLWKKVRRRLKSLGALQYLEFTLPMLQEAWTILMTLAADAERSFQMASRLRSNEFHQIHVYALYRLALHCDDPPRSKIRSILKKVMDFRKYPRPGTARPLCLPMLAHSTFSRSLQTFVSELIQSNKEYLVPFHLPSKKILAGKHQTIADLLYNHQKHLQRWSVDVPPLCPCQRLLQEHPNLATVEGHIASPASLLSVSRRLQTLLQHSAMTSVYPNLEQYVEDTWCTIQERALKNNIHTLQFQQWRQFVLQEWKLHQHAAWTTIKYRDIAYLRSII